jgi:hypothetical protein
MEPLFRFCNTLPRITISVTLTSVALKEITRALQQHPEVIDITFFNGSFMRLQKYGELATVEEFMEFFKDFHTHSVHRLELHSPSNDFMEALVRVQSTVHRITTLRLWGPYTTRVSPLHSGIIPALIGSPSLVELYIYNIDNQAGGSSYNELGRLIASTPLQRLYVNDQALNEEDVGGICAAIPRSQSFTELELNSWQVSCTAETLSSLRGATQLKTIQITSSHVHRTEPLSLDSMVAFVNILPTLTRIESIRLDNRKVDGLAAILLFTAIAYQCPHVVRVDLGDNEISNDHLRVIIDLIPKCAHLEYLNLSVYWRDRDGDADIKYRMDEPTMKRLVEVVIPSKLFRLDISNRWIGDNLASYVASLIRRAVHMRILNIEDQTHGLTPVSYSILRDAIWATPKLSLAVAHVGMNNKLEDLVRYREETKRVDVLTALMSPKFVPRIGTQSKLPLLPREVLREVAYSTYGREDEGLREFVTMTQDDIDEVDFDDAYDSRSDDEDE